MQRQLDRIGFVLHTADLYNHYKNVLAHLGQDSFELIITPDVGASREKLLNALEDKCYPHVELNDALSAGKKYRVLVTNHPISGGGLRRYLPEVLGSFNVRFMYALGKAKHNFSAWNLIYDMIMCHGPYQVRNLEFCRHASKVQMGYPRYDHFFELSLEKHAILEKFGADPSLPTILWVPTWGDVSSLDLFLDTVSELTNDYNILLKPHPLTVSKEPERIERIKQTNFVPIVDELTDITELYSVADFVLSDYGGTIFSALYLDKRLLLLNTPRAELDIFTGSNSPDIIVRSEILNLSHDQTSHLRSMLEDNVLWEEQVKSRSALRRKYFAPYYGYSARVAAAFLENIPSLIPAGGLAGRARKFLSVRARKLAYGEFSMKRIISRSIPRISAGKMTFPR